jgi:hypothetical protein
VEAPPDGVARRWSVGMRLGKVESRRGRIEESRRRGIEETKR